MKLKVQIIANVYIVLSCYHDRRNRCLNQLAYEGVIRVYVNTIDLFYNPILGLLRMHIPGNGGGGFWYRRHACLPQALRNSFTSAWGTGVAIGLQRHLIRNESTCLAAKRRNQCSHETRCWNDRWANSILGAWTRPSPSLAARLSLRTSSMPRMFARIR